MNTNLSVLIWLLKWIVATPREKRPRIEVGHDVAHVIAGVDAVVRPERFEPCQPSLPGQRGCNGVRGGGCAIERSSTRGERPRTATPAGMRPAYIRRTGAAAAAHSRAARTVRSASAG